MLEHAGRCKMRYEWKIIGTNPIWITLFLTAAFLAVSAVGGEEVNWGYLGFEVIFPLCVAVAVGEWCQTRTDPLFEVISAAGGSLFCWILRRFAFLFCMEILFCAAGILGVTLLKPGTGAADLAVVFVPTAFFLASVSMFLSVLTDARHVPAMGCGVIWLFSVMTESLLRFVPVQYIYLFVRYAGVDGRRCRVNKGVLCLAGIILWVLIYIICRRRVWRR